jgi:hypothetical protein
MLEGTTAKSELFRAMSEHLKTKDGPIRPERLTTVLLGVDWGALTPSDRRILVATLARCGFDHVHADGPCWFRKGPSVPAVADLAILRPPSRQAA